MSESIKKMEVKSVDPQIEESWKNRLRDEFGKEYFLNMKKILVEEKMKYRIHPPGNEIFNAFNITPFDKVKVVILGQDPYHGPGQAHGLSFSVKDGITQPPSLKNIMKELIEDVNAEPTSKGNLVKWAEQGVFLLNASLTVRDGQANSHSKIGWHTFTDAVIKKVSDEKENVVFILWGNFAKQKSSLIDTNKHLIITSPHPSPFSARYGFFGSKPFSKANEYLQLKGIAPIEWDICK